MSSIINNKYSYNCAIKDLNHNTNYEVINLKGSICIFLPRGEGDVVNCFDFFLKR